MTLNECGNRIVDEGEDCDGATDCSNTCHFACGQPKQECPSGWGCDQSAGICRAASGSFRPLTLVEESFSRLSVADFDGDGRDDLLAVSEDESALSSVSFFDESGALERTITLPIASSAATGDVSDDGVPDALLGGFSPSAFRSTKSRNFSPLIGALRQVGSTAKLLAADLDCDGKRDFMLLGGDDAKSDATLSRISYTDDFYPLGSLLIGAAQLREREAAPILDAFTSQRRELVATGTFTDVGEHPCEILALPAPDAAAVDIYASRDGGASVVPTTRVSYAELIDAPKRWFFADVDDDWIEDLVISGLGQWVSYGFGDGTFDPIATKLQDVAGEVLAYGDLDGNFGTDAFTDFFNYEDQRYSSARTLDLTGDERRDVAAIGDAKRVDVFRGHQSGLASRLSVRLNGVPRIEDVGDFDGDGGADLLLSEGSGRSSSQSVASVLFSPVTGDTATPLELAQFARIEQLAAAYLQETDPPDANADIGVLYSTVDAQLQLGFLEGGADRLLRSRLPTTSSMDEADGSSTPALGHFHSADTLELAMLKDVYGSDTVATRLELLTLEAGGLSARNYSTIKDFRASRYLALLALDLDGDALDELYVNVGKGLLKLTAQADSFEAAPILETRRFGWLSGQDANADGHTDLTALSRDGLLVLMSVPAGSPAESHHFAYDQIACQRLFEDAFDADDSFDEEFEEPLIDAPFEYAFVQADADAEPELVVNCYSFIGADPFAETASRGDDEPEYPSGPELFVYDVDLARDALTRIGSERIAGPHSGHFVTGDFNGDGIQDIAGGSPSITVLFGMPR